MIKALDTVYRGHKFRSRLEAKWAIFFDEVGIAFQYEPDGYKLSNGMFYLPDFFIPSWDSFVEIKPNNRFVYNDKCFYLARDSGKKVIMFAGEPYAYGILDSCTESHYRTAIFYPDGGVDCGILESCDGPIVLRICQECGGFTLTDNRDNHEHLGEPKGDRCFERLGYFDSKLLSAYTHASQARFEHGEKP